MLAVLFQVPTLSPGQDPLPWIAGLLATACAFLGRELLKRADADIADWKQSAKDAAVALKETTGALNTLSDTVEEQGRQQLAAIERNRQEMAGVRADVAALGARLDAPTATRRRSP